MTLSSRQTVKTEATHIPQLKSAKQWKYIHRFFLSQMQKKLSSGICCQLHVLKRPLVLTCGYKQKKWETELNFFFSFDKRYYQPTGIWRKGLFALFCWKITHPFGQKFHSKEKVTKRFKYKWKIFSYKRRWIHISFTLKLEKFFWISERPISEKMKVLQE